MIGSKSNESYVLVNYFDADHLEELRCAVESNPSLALSSVLSIAKKVLVAVKEEKLSLGQLLELGSLSRKITALSNSATLTFYETYVYPINHEGKSVKQNTQLVVQEFWSCYVKALNISRQEEF